MKLIAITGADASGKDTQIGELSKHFRAQGLQVAIVDIWDSFQDFIADSPRESVGKILDGFLLRFEPDARTLFLQSVLRNSFTKIPKIADLVLLNGYTYKYWATEAAYGASESLWKNRAEVFPEPDRVIYLKTPVETCLARRAKWTAYESGAGRSVDDGGSFTLESFQRRTHERLDAILASRKATVVDGGRDAALVQAELRVLVQSELGPSR